jgi:hypothetical protein
MTHTRSLEGLCHAAVTVTLLLTFSVSSWGQTRLYHGPVGSQAADEAALLNRPHAVIPHHTK